MARLSFRNVNKIYDNKVQAVFDFNLEVQDKEFIVFVGPSGCGKSTTLRMLAGLENISSGEIYLNDTLINDVAPVDRDMAMVFQNYALYPHMSVYDNLAFGLKMRKFPTPIYDEENKLIPSIDVNRIKDLNYDIKVLNKEIKILNKKIAKAGDDSQELKEEIAKKEAKIEEINKQIDYYSSNLTTYKFKMAKMPKAQIDERVKYAADILGLKEYLKRKPANLSGGQRQRVALGRAIVRTPKVFLMDEPLSNLDAKLRVQMRSEIAKIHKKVGATTVYVTHDQTEAMTMADRIVVMKDGYVQQIGSPKEVYNNPENIFVAGFIGSPAMNFIKGIIKDDKFYVYKIINSLDDSSVEEVEITDKYIQLNQNLVNKLKDYNNKAIILGIRPEDIHSVDDNVEEKSNIVDLRCEVSELLGHETIIYGSLEGQTVVSKAPAEIIIETDDIFKCVFDLKKVHFFDLDTTKVIK